MTLQIVLLIALHFVLPGIYFVRLVRSEFLDQAAWLNQAVQAIAFAFFVVLIGRWDWFSRYLRFLPLILAILGVALSASKIKGKPRFKHGLHRPWWRQGLRWLETGVITAAVLAAVAGFQTNHQALDLSLPLDSGTYQAVQAGDSFLLNAHKASQAQSFAVDVVELNSLGARAHGLYPKELDAFEIYGEKVLSPCDGDVVSVRTGLPDLIPPKRDGQNLAGNNIVIRCNGAKVLLAHLQRGSIRVEQGQHLETGEAIATVGNSGNTTEPHLHIHAVDAGSGNVLEGQPVPIKFSGRFPVRNMVFVR